MSNEAKRRQNGFTLVEIMVVIVILGLLAMIVAPNVLGRQAEAEVDTARMNVSQLHGIVTTFASRNGKIPTWEELITPDAKGQAYMEGYTEPPKDPWGNLYEIRQGDTRLSFEVVSLGPDGQEGTEDDISSKTARDSNKKPR